MSRKNKKIYCNCCGNMICTEAEKERTSYLAIEKDWGYFSNQKDGKKQKFDICEPCYEKLVQSFVIPPDEKNITEYI